MARRLEDLLGGFYQSNERDHDGWGGLYDPPAAFPHGVWVTVARMPVAPLGGDGYDVEIDEARYPARFYRVRALPTADSTGKIRPGFALSTGSGSVMRTLAFTVAQAIAAGMLGVEDADGA